MIYRAAFFGVMALCVACADGEFPIEPEPVPEPIDTLEAPAGPVPDRCCVEQTLSDGTGDGYCVCQPRSLMGVPDCPSFLAYWPPDSAGTWRLVDVCAKPTQYPLMSGAPTVWICSQLASTEQCTCARSQQSAASAIRASCGAKLRTTLSDGRTVDDTQTCPDTCS